MREISSQYNFRKYDSLNAMNFERIMKVHHRMFLVEYEIRSMYCLLREICKVNSVKGITITIDKVTIIDRHSKNSKKEKKL